MVFLTLVLALAGALLATAWGLSLYMTHRRPLAEIHTPGRFGLSYEEVEFPATDGLLLRGWWIPTPGSDKAVAVLHGHGGSMDTDVHRARGLVAAGLNVLMFDHRAHGRSEGRWITFGYLEQRDVVGAVRWLRMRGMQHIGLLGFSLGGIVSLLSAAACSDIAAVVADGAPVRLRTAMAGRGEEWGVFRWLAQPMAWLTLAVTSLRLRANLLRQEPVRRVGQISPRPILFIHGDHDQYAPDFDELYSAARPPKELWRVSTAGHTTLSATHPNEHEQRVVSFFRQHL
jgi:fermentation-respiration switch protein FrsA (DUF1100 family)